MDNFDSTQYKRKCDCEQWESFIPEILGFTFLAYQHGFSYTSDPYKFCPWCGKELTLEEVLVGE